MRNHLTVDSCYWQQIIDEQENKKRNFQEYNSELLHVAKQFLSAFWLWKTSK